MFIDNRTPLDVKLARGRLLDSLSVASVVVVTTHLVTTSGLALTLDPGVRADFDSETIRRRPLWKDVSVTASGMVLGPPRPPFVRAVTLSAGSHSERLLVFGERRWRRPLGGGELYASEAQPFSQLPLDFHHAFGGTVLIPPGPDRRTGLPHPGGCAAYPSNPTGRGFFLDEAAAVDGLLPNVEAHGAPTQRWHDRPVPAGFAPCPDLHGIRVPPDLGPVGGDHGLPAEQLLPAALRFFHHAPGRWILDDLVPGAPVAVSGLGTAEIRFEIPMGPARITVRRRGRDSLIPAALRSVHVDVAHALVQCVYGHTWQYDPACPPSRVRVELDAANQLARRSA